MKKFFAALLILFSLTPAWSQTMGLDPSLAPPKQILSKREALKKRLRHNSKVIGVGIGVDLQKNSYPFWTLVVYAQCPVLGVPSKFKDLSVSVQCTETVEAQ